MAQNIVLEQEVKKKKCLSKKAKIWIVCSICAIFACVGTFLAIFINQSRSINWHGFTIANYQNYMGIGVANFGDGNSSNVYASSFEDKSGELKLAGITKDNTCEEIEFVKNDGKIQKQNARLIHFDAYDKFTLFTLTTNDDYEFVEEKLLGGYDYVFTKEYIRMGENNSISYKDASMFILDHKTGKIYNIQEVMKVAQEMFSTETLSLSFINLNNSNFTKQLLLICWKGWDYSGGNNLLGIIQISLTDSGMEVSKRLSDVQLSNWKDNGDVSSVIDSISQDVYGNILKRGRDYYNNKKILAYQKNDGYFVTLDYSHGETYTLGMNSVFYKQLNDKTYYLNDSGEFEEIEFDEILINVLNTEFYYKDGETILCGDDVNIYKMNLDKSNAWKYEVEIISFPREQSNTTVGRGNFIYSLNLGTKKLS